MDNSKKNNQKENDITTGEIFKSKYGTFNVDNPKVLYLNVKAKVQPLDKKTNYAHDIKKVKSLFGEYVEGFFRNENKKFSDKFIYSCDVSENNITFGKKSNLKYEVLVKPIESKQFDDYTEDMTELSNTLSSGLSRIMMEHQFEVC